MNLVILVIIVQSEYHWDKNVINPGKGTWIKGINELPNWLIEIAERFTEPEPDSVAEIIQKWNDSNNNIFPFGSSSKEVFMFQGTERSK